MMLKQSHILNFLKLEAIQGKYLRFCGSEAENKYAYIRICKMCCIITVFYLCSNLANPKSH